MYDTITAMAIAVSEDRFFVDPTEEEEYVALIGNEKSNHGLVTLSALIELNQLSDFTQVGSMDVECVNKAMDILYAECKNMLQHIRKCLVKYVKESFVEKIILETESKKREKLIDLKVEEWKSRLKPT